MPGIPGNNDFEDKYDDLKTPVVSLKEGLPIKEFITNQQTEFEIKPDEDDGEKESQAAESCFDFDEIEKVVNLDMIDIDIEDGEDGTPFDRYRRKMVNIRDDGKVKKFVVKQGVGPLVTENSIVYIRYQAYMEYSEVPFDSTLWQCSGEGDLPMPFNLAKGQLLQGLYELILTMRKGEKAEALVHPDLAYGSLGCPPRIPPEATVLFVVEIDRFVECGEAVEDQDDLDIYERKEFRNVLKKAKSYYLYGNDLVKRENYGAAANKYRLVINMMHNARMADEEEEKERNHFLLKNYTNACLCYKKLKNYKRICILAADAKRVDEEGVMKNAKLLYFWGYSKMMLGDFAAAKEHLCKAQRIFPRDSDISGALVELEKKKKDALMEERIIARRAFGNRTTTEVTISELDETEEEFRKVVQEDLDSFANDPNRDSLYIKDQKFTSQEEKIYLGVARALGLHARVADGEKRIIHIKKPDYYYD